MKPPAPSSLVATLHPPEAMILKREARTLVWRERRPDGTAIVVKLYRKRGLITVLRSRLLRFRTEREYRRLRHLQRSGIPCTEALAWGAGWSTEHGRHEILVMREVPHAVELGQYLKEGGVAPLDPLYQIVRKMHESGFCCQTLYLRNVLLNRDAAPGEGYFLSDVPRSWTFPGSLVGSELALYDLFDLTFELEALGIPIDSIPLEAYGLDAEARIWWDRVRQKGDPRTKATRRLRDLKARLRWAVSWTKAWARSAVRRATP